MKLTTSKDRTLSFMRALVHGDSGIGKTSSFRTLPNDRTLIVCAERGLLPLRRFNFPVAIIETWPDVRELVATLQKGGPIDGRTITVVAIDSLTELSEMCKRQIVEVDRRRLCSERSGGKSEVPRGIYDDQMTQEDWGLYATRMNALLGTLCHLPYHVILTALSTWTENKMTGQVLRTPDVNGKLAFECPAYFDVVLFMESGRNDAGEEARVWRTSNNGQVLAKDASGMLDAIEPADWTALMLKVFGNGNGSTNSRKEAQK